jgi:hypothetical protein
MTKRLPAVTAAAARGTGRRYDLPPLRWWRGDAPDRLDRSAAAELRQTLSRIRVPALTNWRAAARGEACVAVRIALGVASHPGAPDWLIDCAGSALLLCALEGSPAAGMVLAYLRRRLAAGALAMERGA